MTATNSIRAAEDLDGAVLREPPEVIGFDFRSVTDSLRDRLRRRTFGPFFDILEELDVQLLVSREYEHLLLSLRTEGGSPRISYLPLPHPTGFALDKENGAIHVAATRNPNQLYRLERVQLTNGDLRWMPVGSTILPGSLYMHDLAYIGTALHANAVGHNAVVAFSPDGHWNHVWWPNSVTQTDGLDRSRNHIQLNSIAAGNSLEESFFSASCEAPGEYPPGHERFEVDGRGVIFSGRTREVIARGLTRPHSARLRNDEIWVDNSGYGELGRVVDGQFESFVKLPGWTRGLTFAENLAIVGSSTILPRFRHYAPGVERATCGVHLVDLATSKILASCLWPNGNQIFSIEVLRGALVADLPYVLSSKKHDPRPDSLFFDYA